MRHEGLAGGPIGMPSALQFPVAQHRLHEDSRSQLRFQQSEGVPVRNWRYPSGEPSIAAVGLTHRMEW